MFPALAAPPPDYVHLAGPSPAASPQATATPGGVGTGPPSGTTPNAKRPATEISRENVQSAGESRPRGAEAVTEALQTLLNRNNQTDAHLLSTGQSVSYNADLLNALVTRVNILEAAGSSS